MTELVATLGLPASGKTTFAKELQQAEGHVRVNKDDLRKMLHGLRPWNRADEDVTAQVSDALIFMLLNRGRSVVCDDTNFERLEWLRQIASNASAKLTLVDFTAVPVQTCIERDARRPTLARVGEGVIRKMAERNGLT